ncbi:MAG TPA: GNAT family N-acetyltransferase [Mycobacteriales bacterium]|jgi:predicted GNAT superfamily acetyltransferase|nr:GNAT family N-acetyltransferase [Mycobacteriales bacterium]
MTDVVQRGAYAAAPGVPGLTIDEVHTEADARAAVAALAAVWPRPDGAEPLPPELAWVFAHSGNYVAVARSASEVVGAAIGFRGVDDDGPHLHSHIAGVLPDRQGASIGFALKQHQRRWALAAGLDRVTWTFDPLVARNAYFNVVKLGARLTGYYVDFYGPMTDGINNGDETDRCLVTWRLDDPAALSAAAGRSRPADVVEARHAGADVLLAVGARGEPVRGAAKGALRLVQVPADIVALRRTDAAQSRAWRQALREVLVAAFADGFEVVGASRDSWYVLAPVN